jgi:cyclopropane-fatty-acyl-phospholipid synthase
LLRLFAWRHRNTRGGSRANIAAHYDLGNDLFERFLDPSMTYSSAVFEDDDCDLASAQRAKYDRLCGKLALRPDDHVLEIGSGWGGFAIHAATHYGCRVTTTTISRQQFELARERVARAGVADRVEILMTDYRDLAGTYDKLVSIEMVEAVGHQYMEEFFRLCCERLRPDGLCAIQAIVHADQVFEESKRTVDFIKRYIFPGGSLPCVWSMCDAAKNATDFRLIHLEDIGEHYARTLAMWRQRFLENREAIRGLGYEERFLRMWEFYLAYCEGAFEERAIGAVQTLFARPEARRRPILGALPRSSVRNAA